MCRPWPLNWEKLHLRLHRRSHCWLRDLPRRLDCYYPPHEFLGGTNHVMCCLSLRLLRWHLYINLVLQGPWGTQVINGNLKAPKRKLIDIYILCIHQEREICPCSHVYSFCWKQETSITGGDSDPGVPPHFSSCQDTQSCNTFNCASPRENPAGISGATDPAQPSMTNSSSRVCSVSF